MSETEDLYTAEMTEVAVKAVRNIFNNPAVTADHVISNESSDIRQLISLIAEIRATTGIELPIGAFTGETKVESIGRMLAAKPARLPLARKLCEGSGESIFLLPGISGATFELNPLADQIKNLMDLDYSIYALTYPGLDGLSLPVKSIRELGKILFSEIRIAVPVGRVHLIGYSAGGCVAVEVANELGVDNVGLLGIIDAPIHVQHWPFLLWFRFETLKLLRSVGVSKTFSRQRRGPQEIKEKTHVAVIRRIQAVIYQRYGNVAHAKFLVSFRYRVDGLPSNIQSVRDATILAMGQDAPSRYIGSATYFETNGGDQLMCKPAEIWTRFLPNVAFSKVSGCHISVLQIPHVATLAAMICRALTARDRT